MTKLKELEKRLRDEPENLGLRVALAGELREAGRVDDAVELYRSVAIAYRTQGRTQQAISVCRAVLDIAPDDASCQALLVAMTAERAPVEEAASTALGNASKPVHEPPPLAEPEPEPEGDAIPRALPRRGSSAAYDITPLPEPLPHHVAEPTIPPMPIVPADRPIRLSPADLPPTLRAQHERETRDHRLDTTDDLRDSDVLVEATIRPRLEGIANAARQISASLLAADAVAVGRDRIRIHDGAADDEAVDETFDADDVVEVTEAEDLARDPDPLDPDTTRKPRLAPGMRASRPSIPRIRPVDDEKTAPREVPHRPPAVTAKTNPAVDPTELALHPLDSPLFAAIPKHNRAGVLQRFRRRPAAIGTTVIRRGETGHGLVLVVRGRLDVHSEGGDGSRVSLEAIVAGGFVGEISLLARAPAAAYVVAAIDSELLVLAATDFYEVAGAFPVWRNDLRASAEQRSRDYTARLR